MPAVSAKKMLLLGLLTVLFIAIPITLYLVKTQTQNKSNATAATTLAFDPVSTPNATVNGTPVVLNVMLNPNGTNQVSYVKLRIIFDSAKLKMVDNGFVATTALPSTLEQPTVTQNSNGTSTANMTISAGADPTKIVTTLTKIATITFQPIAAGTAAVSFDQTNMQVLSAGADSTSSENVLSSASPATITIGAATTTTVTPTPTTTTGTTGTGTTTTTTTTTATNTAPTCTALGLDRAAAGAAPYSLTFTASGTDTGGTVSKVSFNFGDGPVQDVTTGGNIGTSSVSVQAAHTYINPGTYTATAVLTDNGNAVSPAVASCTQTITVSQAAAAAPAQQQAQAAPAQSAPAQAQPVTGPGETILGIGAIGGVITVIGAVLLFAL